MGQKHLSRRAQWAGRQKIGYLMQQGVDFPDCLSLAAGLVDYATLPSELVRKTADQLLLDPARQKSVLQYGTTPGSLELRASLCQHLAELDGVSVAQQNFGVEQVFATTGSQQFLDLVTQAVCDPGDIVLVTAPSYFVYLSTLEGIGCELVPVTCDEEGICVAALDEALSALEAAGKLPRVKVLYLVSYFDNPRGSTLGEARRREILDCLDRWLKKQFIYLLEDAAYRELWFDSPPPPSFLQLDSNPDRVIYTQTFSKSLSPGLRTAFGIVPPALVKPFDDLKSIHDFGSPNFSQAILLELLKTGGYHEHVADLRQAYREKGLTLFHALENSGLLSGQATARAPEGGLYVWLQLNDSGITTGFEDQLFRTAAQDFQVMYVPGELFYADSSNPEARLTMRLSYGVQPTGKLATGIERLAGAIQAVAGQPQVQ